jgi:similar to stage IV sporulation protein
MMVAGALLFLVALNVLSSYIWFVDVTGLKTLKSERILAIVDERGLRPGVFKNTIDTKQLENAILFNVPEIAWVGISFTGTRAQIEVVEKTLPKTEDKTPAHIVAMKDGVVTEIITIAGQSSVKKDDTVKKGDLLIKGFAAESVRDSYGQPTVITVPSQLIRAKGIVKARVWYESYGEASLVREIRHRTGRQEVGVEALVGSNSLILKRTAAQPFSLFTTETIHKKLPWRNSGLVVESIITVYHEEESNWQEITLDEARDEAKMKALKAVESQIPESANIISRNIEVLKTAEPNLVRVKISFETIEEIGQSMNITQQQGG